ncbi:MAG TPA: CDP-alcohol phosphatidyltransferase family protein [Bryobacteraceae bacterium]|jgi:cardiolipin synthase|nr:CDP-alcohol phosphatidyltransferase family protein [Bryobacteraceae bacterium]
MPRWFNLPNLLTLVRLVLVPFVIQAILEGRHFLALLLFAIAAVTDAMDGAAARYFALTTQAGAYLDPIADKCLLSGVFLAMAVARIVPWWFVAVVFGRDLYILIGAAAIWLMSPIREFPPSVWGKTSTFVQILTAVTWMARDVLELSALNLLSAVMLWLCMVFTLWSGIHYTWRGVQLARAH